MQTIKINRSKIIDFINSVDEKLEAQFHENGKIYETPLRSFLLEGLIISEQKFKNEDANANLHYIRETKIQSQNEIIRYQIMISESWSKNHSDTEAVIKQIHKRIKVQEYLIQFMDLLHSEYLESYFLNQQIDNQKQNSKINSATTPSIFVATEGDTRYSLEDSFYSLYERQYLIEQIEDVGHFSVDYKGNQVRVYIGDIAALFAAKQVEVKDLETSRIEMIDGTQFLNSYVTRFNEGSEYFKETYRVSPNILFGPEAKAFGESLHFQYFHSQENSEGWHYWIKHSPRIITQRTIGNYGYYAGIIYSFKQMANEYPDLFNKYVFATCNKNDGSEEQRTNKSEDRMIAEITISDLSDYAKLQRGVISLPQQIQANTGNAVANFHPFLWHTKTHEISSPYILKVNNDEEVTDETGKIINRKKITITDADVDEAFINYIISCHINQIDPFLTYQFTHFYNRLKADEPIQPFFDHILSLAKTAKQRGVLYRSEADVFTKWIKTHPYYERITEAQNLSSLTISTLVKADEVISLSHTQIALLYHYTRKPINRNNCNEIAQKYGQTSGQRLETTYKELTSELQRTAKGRNKVKDIETVLPSLSGNDKALAEKELRDAKKNNRK